MTGSVLFRLSSGLYVHVDAADLPILRLVSWCSLKSKNSPREVHYAQGHFRGRSVPMHRFLLEPDRTQIVDHINGDGLDNRRCNLRAVSRSENVHNRHEGLAPLGVGILPLGVPIVEFVPVPRRAKRWYRRPDGFVESLERIAA